MFLEKTFSVNRRWVGFLLFILFALITSLWITEGWAQGKIKLRWATYRTSKEELAIFDKIIKDFEKENPNITIEIEPVAWKDQMTYIVGSIASHTEPDIINLMLESVSHYAKFGYLASLDDLIDEIGRSDFYEDILEANTYKGKIYAMPWDYTRAIFWYRKDLFSAKGLKPPKTWEELLECAKALTQEKEGIYGIVVPYGRNQWTAVFFESFLWSNGGNIFDKSFNIIFNSKENAQTLKYLNELSKLSPPGSSEYSYEQTMNTFVVGKAAMIMYFGRLLSAVYQRNPDLKDKMGTFIISKKEQVKWNGMGMLGVMKGSKYPKEAKKFLKYYITNPDYVKILHSVPTHYWPSIKSVARSGKFLSHPLFKAHPDVIETMRSEMGSGKQVSWEYPGYSNPYADGIVTSQIIEDTVQRVLLKGDSPEKALAWAQKEMESALEETKKIEK